jgi:NADPH:quinone reductase-like Zn-dependent oxidoreductase
MKAIQIQSTGGLEVFKVATLPEPEPVADQALIRIKAAAVNPLDGIIRMGDFP